MENNQNKNLVLIEDLGMLYHTENSKKKYRFGLYKCYCGNEFKTVIRNVKTGHTRSCGCYSIKKAKQTINKEKEQKEKKNILIKTSIPIKNHRLYNTWRGMIKRCLNPKSKPYNRYGGRGIIVCDRWRVFKNFADDMYPTFKEGLTIDRINNDLGYSPENCRWATKSLQVRNTTKTRENNKSGYRGVSWHKNSNKWTSKISVNKKRIHLGYFNDKIEAAIAYDKYVIDNNLEHTKNFS